MSKLTVAKTPAKVIYSLLKIKHLFEKSTRDMPKYTNSRSCSRMNYLFLTKIFV